MTDPAPAPEPHVPHVLLVGGGNMAFSERYPAVRTSFLTLQSRMSRFTSLAHHQRVLTLRSEDGDTAWLDAAAVVHAADPIDAVASFAEPLSLLASKIATRIGARGVPPVETARLVIDKRAMRDRLADLGVEGTRAHVVATPEELETVLSGSTDAWIVKPVSGSGSAGVSSVRLVDGPASLRAAFERATDQGEAEQSADPANRAVIVEPFLVGPQFSVEAVTEQGRTTVLAVTAKLSDPDTFVELGHVVPAPLPEADREAVSGHASRVIEALGITDAVTHTEVVLTPDGPRVIETHTRLGGDDIAEMASIVSGVDLSEAALDLLLAIPLAPRLERAEPSVSCEAVWFVVCSEPGTYAGIDTTDVGEDVAVTELLAVGDPVGELASSDSRVAQVRASGATAEEALRRVREAADRVVVRVARDVRATASAATTL